MSGTQYAYIESQSFESDILKLEVTVLLIYPIRLYTGTLLVAEGLSVDKMELLLAFTELNL